MRRVQTKLYFWEMCGYAKKLGLDMIEGWTVLKNPSERLNAAGL